MPYGYSNIEYTEMVRVLARCGDNVRKACREYALLFPNVPTPSARTMFNVTQRLRDYGQFRPRSNDSGRPLSYSVRTEEKILEFFEANPAASTNEVARRFNVSQSFAWSVLHNMNAGGDVGLPRRGHFRGGSGEGRGRDRLCKKAAPPRKDAASTEEEQDEDEEEEESDY